MNPFRRTFRSLVRTLVVALTLPAAAHAVTVSFLTDPFAGSDALTTPGRQIVGNELFTDFNIASDVFLFDSAAFGLSGGIEFANDEVASLPATGLDVIVLRTFDNDGNPVTPFGAGSAANLIAGQVTSPGAGLYIYFNSALDLPRLVYSTDLSDETADLKILARLTNLGGAAGRAAMADFTAANFQIATVPDSGGVVLLLLAMGALAMTRKIIARRRS